jgi:DNA (cytosine-5)-methyltransferase 1
MGYGVEWRVINAADYGHAQRRRRVYIIAFHNTTGFYKNLYGKAKAGDCVNMYGKLYGNGFFAPAFPVQDESELRLGGVESIDGREYSDLAELSNSFSTTFHNSGIMLGGSIYSEEVTPIATTPKTLREIRQTEPVSERHFINGSLEKWQFLKGAKRIPRVRPNGEPYFFSEGAISFPDDLDKPSRTMLTSESSVNRTTHVIEDAVTGNLRVLTPIECERLNGFDDDWTNTGMPEKSRYFTMGNALVVPVVESIGNRLLEVV